MMADKNPDRQYMSAMVNKADLDLLLKWIQFIVTLKRGFFHRVGLSRNTTVQNENTVVFDIRSTNSLTQN